MKVMHSEWKGRIEHWIRTLKDDLYLPLGEFQWEAFRTMDHISLEEAGKGPFEPVKPGFTWGKTWEYAWFRSNIVLPQEAEGKRIVMNLKPGENRPFLSTGRPSAPIVPTGLPSSIITWKTMSFPAARMRVTVLT